MADRQKFCVAIMSILILISLGYLGYYLFINPDHNMIQKFNHVRLCIFFGQHLVTLGMLARLLWEGEEHDLVVRWMFQLSTGVVLAFVGGEVFVLARGGKLFGSAKIDYTNMSDRYDAILEFQLNEITLYFQIMTDFVMFFIVSSVAMIVLRCKSVDSEQRYEFMIDNLKSEDYVEEANAAEKKGCAICLTDLEAERVLKLPCEHVFHKECLVNWLKRSTVCPMCRNDIEESLAPNSPQRLPPVNSQPIILPPPQHPAPNNIQLNNNPTIQHRRSISLSNRSQHNNSPIQQRPQSRYQIFEQARSVNNGGSQRNQGQKNDGIVEQVNFVNHENELSARMRKELMRENQLMEREVMNLGEPRRGNNVLSVSRAITQRKAENQSPFNNMRHPSSPHMCGPQTTRINKIPRPHTERPLQGKKMYLNPNQNLFNTKIQERQNLHDVSINDMVRQDVV